MTFTRAANVSGTTIEDTYKNKIFKSDNKGLLGILKTDFSNSTEETAGKPTKAEAIQTKIDFIRHCGYERGVSKNKEISGGGSGNELEVSVPAFSFKAATGGSNLVPVDETHFRN